MSRLNLERAVPILTAAAVLGLWEAASRAGLVSPLFFPRPTAIAGTLISMGADGTLLRHTMATLTRLVAGVIVGGAAGLTLGAVIGWFPPARRMFDPIVAALHPLPKIALLPLLMVILGIGEASKVAAIALGSFFPMVINTTAGVRHIPHAFFEMVESYVGTRRDLFRHVVVPGMLPMALAGARVAMNTALMIAVAIEFVAAERGIGRLIWMGWQSLVTERLWAGLVLIGLIGVLLNAAIDALTRTLVRWQPDRDK